MKISHKLAVTFSLFIGTGLVSVWANSYSLDANPNYSFPSGTFEPGSGAMAAAIQTSWGGKPVTTVGSLLNENTAYPPVVADSNVAPFYVFGPATNGTIQNINRAQNVVTGIVRGELHFVGTDQFGGWANLSRYVLRAYTTTQYYDVSVKVISWSGSTMPNTFYSAAWSFYQVSAPRPIPLPVTVTSAVSRKAHGSVGSYDVILPMTGAHGIDCRNGGANQIGAVIIAFSNTLKSVSSASIGGSASVTSSAIGADAHQYVVNLRNIANAQHLIVNLNGVTDSMGHYSATVSVPMDVLVADTDATGKVNATDVTNVQNQAGHPLTSSNFREDVNNDGVIDSADVTVATNKKGTVLP